MNPKLRSAAVMVLVFITMSVLTAFGFVAGGASDIPAETTRVVVTSSSTTTTTKASTVAETTTTAAPTTTTTTTTKTTTKATPAVTNSSDTDLFARLIYCEAGGCSYRHKQLVGAVVINRVNSSKFPNTLRGVIYQSGQYSPVSSGKINRVTPDAECYEIARNLLAYGTGGICPSNVLFQANFRQGTGVYEILQSPYGTTTYFCYG